MGGEKTLRKSIISMLLLAAGSFAAWSQSSPTASRLGDLQVGGEYSSANSDYVGNRIRGFGFYGTFDFKSHYGVELNFHQLNDPNSIVYERSYEAGGRYIIKHYNRFTPYVKGMYGRGVFNFPAGCIDATTGLPLACGAPNSVLSKDAAANLAYNQLIGAGGVDIAVHPRINVRAEFEYQHWFGFPPHGLTPTMVNIGVAYHFQPGKPKKLYAGH